MANSISETPSHQFKDSGMRVKGETVSHLLQIAENQFVTENVPADKQSCSVSFSRFIELMKTGNLVRRMYYEMLLF